MASGIVNLNIPSLLNSVDSIGNEKCTIASLDLPKPRIKAVFNPNKLKFSKSVPWDRHPPAGGDGEMLEFTNAKNRSLSMELFFDGYEQHDYIHKGSQKEVNVEKAYVNDLLQLTNAEIPVYKGQSKAMRPHFVVVVWGKLGTLKGVIESIDVDYSLFLPDGTPVRATCSLKITEVDPLQFLKNLTKKK